MKRDDLMLIGVAGLGLGALALLASRVSPSSKSPPGSPDWAGSSTPRPEGLTEAEALGRVITSEANHHTLAERAAVGWAVRNRAQKRKTTVARLVCTPDCGPCCKGRPFSSARPATDENLSLAKYILASPQVDDPTLGASAILEPALQDKLHLAGNKDHKATDDVRKKWSAGGQRYVATVGRWELWT